MDVNEERIRAHLEEVGSLSKNGKGYTRLAYSKEEDAALQWLKKKVTDNDIGVRQDSVGNVFGRIGSSDKPAILIGSHLDTVNEGGLYDGALGVVLGLECLLRIKETGTDINSPLELVAFRGEEANVLGGTFGSRAFAGMIEQNDDFRRNLNSVGYTLQDVVSAKNKKNYSSYVELHIEQGAVLEVNEKQIGIVTSIAGIIRLKVIINGRSSHSGTTPMNLRNDALIGASNIILEVNRIANEMGSDNVATVGEISAHPNQANVVPGSAELTVEIRGSKLSEMKTVEEKIKSYIKKLYNAEITKLIEKMPSELSKRLQDEVEGVCQKNCIPYLSMPSGANHDANSVANIMEAGMIFVPSKDGVSHHPDEFTSFEDITTGAQVMLKTVINLIE